MYIERLVLGNGRHLEDREHDFTAGCGHLRRWVLLPRNQAPSNLLRALALAGLGFRQVRFLRSLPGAYVFVQRYRPVPGGPPADPSRLFDERADALLDELARIIFPQNMKSMETYYRWVAVQYAAQAGRIHHRLVETLFRYNGRPRMSSFLHRLSELAGRAGAGASSTV